MAPAVRQQRRQHDNRRDCQRGDADRGDDTDGAQRRIARRDERAVAEHGDAAATRITGASSSMACARLAALAISLHEVDPVVDADADERHDGEEREQIQLGTGEREQARPPRPGRSLSAAAPAPRASQFAERRDHDHDDDQRADGQSADELRKEAVRQLAIHERQPGQRRGRVDRPDRDSSVPATCGVRCRERRTRRSASRSPCRATKRSIRSPSPWSR